MNYFAHAYRFLDSPYFVVGTGVPDWLSVVDRGVRIRLPQALLVVEEACPETTALVRGVIQHLRDDARFHQTRAFTETCLRLSEVAREALGIQDGFQSGFLGHLLVEVLLDASLIAEDPQRLQTYYGLLEAVEPRGVEADVNRIASRPTQRLAWMIVQFRRERILWDYLEDGKLLRRLDQVMARVGFTALPLGFAQLLPDARRLVEDRKDELLAAVLA